MVNYEVHRMVMNSKHYFGSAFKIIEVFHYTGS